MVKDLTIQGGLKIDFELTQKIIMGNSEILYRAIKLFSIQKLSQFELSQFVRISF